MAANNEAATFVSIRRQAKMPCRKTRGPIVCSFIVAAPPANTTCRTVCVLARDRSGQPFFGIGDILVDITAPGHGSGPDSNFALSPYPDIIKVSVNISWERQH